MKKIKVKYIYVESKVNRKNYIEFTFVAKVKVGFNTKIYRFITMDKHILCAYLESEYLDKIPTNKEIRQQILIKVYGKLMQLVGECDIENILKEQEKEDNK